MSTTNEEVGGLLDVIATEEPGGIPENKNAEAPESESSTPTEPDEEVGDDTQDHSRLPIPETEPEPVAEPSQPEEVAPAEPEVADDWTPQLPPAPAPFNLPEPQVNEDGVIVNMDAAQYQQYIVEKAKYDIRQELYSQNAETLALDAAEKILPEIKTNPGIRSMVENIRIASILTGNQVNSFEAAKQVKEALGLSTSKVAEARAAGAQNAKVSISTQKAATLQTNGSSQPTQNKTQNRELSKRLNRGDTDAFSELFDIWQEEGKV